MKRIIILLLVFCCFQFLYGEEILVNVDSVALEQIQTRFLEKDHPIHYDSNMLIMLQGFPTKEDSLIVNELIDSLNMAIDKWDVYLIPKGTANLIIEINLPHTGDWKNFLNQNNNQNEIIKSTIYLDLPPEMDFVSRKKIFYFNILRSLVVFNADQKDAVSISGSVFSELNAENVTFNPVDLKIIKEIYSISTTDKSVENTSLKSLNNSSRRPTNSILINLLGLFVSFLFLTILSIKGVFRDHRYDFFLFFKQGLLVVLAIAFYTGIVSFSVAPILSQNLHINLILLVVIAFVLVLVLGLIIVCLVFYIERKILHKSRDFGLEVLIPFISISFVTTTPLVVIFIIIPANNTMVVMLPLLSSIGVNTLLIGLGRSIYIYSRKKAENLIRVKDVELAQMGELHKQAELQSLRAKINPHFLYNALNSIASLAATDAHKTEQMALALSDFFKYAINRDQKQLNTLFEELNATHTYLEIEKVRFGDRLSFEIDCPEELFEIQIPQLIIQPLVENAIKHGLLQITENGLIRISVKKEENQLKIQVSDNGPAFPEGPLCGFGIQNTVERITLLYGVKAKMNWQNGDDKYVEISIPV